MSCPCAACFRAPVSRSPNVGQAAEPADTFTLTGTTAALKKIGPSLLLGGVAMGFSIAIGAAFAHYLFERR